jgi:Spy/CpxP family protein refolding chaperone
MTEPAASSIPKDMASENASVETEAMQAFRKRVSAVVTPEAVGRFGERLATSRAEDEELGAMRERVKAALTPEAQARFQERLEMSRRLEDENGNPGGYNGDVP